MILHNLFETLYTYLDQLTEDEIWEILDALSEQQALEISDWLSSNNDGLPAKLLIQIQGIHEYYREHKKFITDTQRRWLLINSLLHWDKLSIQGRRYIL